MSSFAIHIPNQPANVLLRMYALYCTCANVLVTQSKMFHSKVVYWYVLYILNHWRVNFKRSWRNWCFPYLQHYCYAAVHGMVWQSPQIISPYKNFFEQNNHSTILISRNDQGDFASNLGYISRNQVMLTVITAPLPLPQSGNANSYHRPPPPLRQSGNANSYHSTPLTPNQVMLTVITASLPLPQSGNANSYHSTPPSTNQVMLTVITAPPSPPIR